MLLISSCSQGPEGEEFFHTGSTMGTTFHISVVLRENQAPPQSELLDSELERINGLMSTYRNDSELSRFNREKPGVSVTVSRDFCTLLSLSRKVYQLSGGAFDPAVGPLVDLWGFGPGETQGQIPSDEAIASLAAAIEFGALQADCNVNNTGDTLNTVAKQAPIRLDFSAIAKGYAADRVAQLLQERGYNDYLVEVGGELALSGNNSSGEPWRIAIEKPSLLQSGVQLIIGLTDVSVATSGDYRNYFEKDGKRYSHTIDPRTGRPITHNLASVTVIAETAAEADALATALMVLGLEQGMALAERRGIAAYFLAKQGEGFVDKASSRFEDYLPGEDL